MSTSTLIFSYVTLLLGSRPALHVFNTFVDGHDDLQPWSAVE